MSKFAGLFNKILSRFKKNKESSEAEIDANVEVLDKTGSENAAEITSGKKGSGAFSKIKKKFRIRLKLKKPKKADGDDAENNSAGDGESGDEEKKTKKKKKEKKPKVKKEKKSKHEKEKKTDESGDGDDDEDGKHKKIKPIVLIAIIGGGILAGAAAFLIISFMHRPSIEKQLLDAQILLNDSKYTEAAAAYEKIIKKDKKRVEAYIGLADAMVGENNTNGAIQRLTEALVPTEDDAKIKDKITELTPKPAEDPQAPREPSPDPIVFKDAAFAALLRQAIGKSPSEPVSEVDLAAITTLKIVGGTHAAIDDNIYALNKKDGYIIDSVKYTDRGAIKSLADLAHFSKLRKLTIAYNSVEDISGIDSVTALETVGLYFNNIKDISPLSKLTNLKYLYIYDNQISDISPLSTLTQLEQLWLNSNQISNISAVKSLSNLEELFLNDNKVTDISPVSGLSNLCFLYFNNNNVSDISAVKNLQSLSDISFTGNPVKDSSPASHVRNINRSYS